MVSGFPCVEWLDRTTSSDSTPSMWALEYCHDAVFALFDRPVPFDRDDRMGLDRRGDGNFLQALDEGMVRRHVVDGCRDDRKTHKSVPILEDVSAHLGGDGGRGHEPMNDVAEKFIPRNEAAAMRGANEHHARDFGQRLDEQPFWSSSRVASDRCSSWSGLRLTAFQRRSPVLMACILTRRPPWLCPISTIRRRAGSFPSGSSRATAAVRASRRWSADSAIGLPESYWKNQN